MGPLLFRALELAPSGLQWIGEHDVLRRLHGPWAGAVVLLGKLDALRALEILDSSDPVDTAAVDDDDRRVLLVSAHAALLDLRLAGRCSDDPVPLDQRTSRYARLLLRDDGPAFGDRKMMAALDRLFLGILRYAGGEQTASGRPLTVADGEELLRSMDAALKVVEEDAASWAAATTPDPDGADQSFEQGQARIVGLRHRRANLRFFVINLLFVEWKDGGDPDDARMDRMLELADQAKAEAGLEPDVLIQRLYLRRAKAIAMKSPERELRDEEVCAEAEILYRLAIQKNWAPAAMNELSDLLAIARSGQRHVMWLRELKFQRMMGQIGTP
jgi:hypothetical protein